MKLSTGRVDALTWLLIYGGLLSAALGLALRRQDGMLGWGVVVAGAVAAVLGGVMLWVRSRMADPPAAD